MNKIIKVDGVEYSITTLPNGDLCKKRVTKDEEPTFIESVEEDKVTQDDILAEILLTQAEILANQNAQDEVLAEMLLNSLEV